MDHGSRRADFADFGFLVLSYRDRATPWSPGMFFPTFLGVNPKDPDPTVFVLITIKRPLCREDSQSR